MNDLVIRADAGPDTGAGHVMRMLALGQYWQKRNGNVVLVGSVPPGLSTLLRNEGINIHSIAEGTSGLIELQEVFASLSGTGCLKPWLAIDGYQFDEAYQNAVCAMNVPVLWMDDNAALSSYQIDLVLNQNGHADSSMYSTVGPRTEVLAGHRFVLLRKEFLRAERVCSEDPLPLRVLVMLGGSDANDMALLTLRALAEVKGVPLDVRFLSAGNKALATCVGAVREVPYSLSVESEMRSMPDEIAWAHMAVSAAGSSSLELAYMGLPAVLISIADNQIEMGRFLHRAGCAYYAGDRLDISRQALSAVIAELAGSAEIRAQMRQQAKTLIDGQGVRRVYQRMRARQLSLRPVCEGDCRQIWDWANDPKTRAASFSSSEKIGLEQHIEWFNRKLVDANVCMFMVEGDRGGAVGQVRFDADDRKAIISLSLAPSMRGAGLGVVVLEKACREYGQLHPGRELEAWIKTTNRASLHTFGAAGFTRKKSCSREGCEAEIYTLQLGEG